MQLADEQAVDPQVGKGQEADLPHTAEDEQGTMADGNDGPVDGQAAVRCMRKMAPQFREPSAFRYRSRLKMHVVGPDAPPGPAGTAKISRSMIWSLFTPNRGAHRQHRQHGQQKAAGDDDAVPVHRAAKQREGHPVQGGTPAPGRERSRCCIMSAASSLGRTTDRAVRSGVTQRAMQGLRVLLGDGCRTPPGSAG